MSSSSPAFGLLVAGNTYGGWTSISVRRSIEELAWSFRCTYTDRWLADADPTPINTGDSCVVTIDGVGIISGYVDDSSGSYEGNSHSLEATGRSKAGDLCDCSAIFQGGRWKQATLTQIATDLCQPFGLEVIADTDVGNAIPVFSIEPGETVYSALDRAARLRGILVTSDAGGNVRLTRAGQTKSATQIAYGANVKSSSKRSSWKDRFSFYQLLGQSQGNDNWNGTAAAHISATANDPYVKRYRPLQVNIQEQGTAGLQQHVQWEANVRAGRSARYTYRVPGWYCAEGVWQPNVMVSVEDPNWGLEEDLLIVTVELSRSAEGTIAELELAPRAAFDLVQFPARKVRRKAIRNEAKADNKR